MTDPTTTGTPDARPPARPERPKLALSPAQVAGSLLASVSAAVVASYFGVAGTIIGTAVASVFATVGSALYAHGIRRSAVQVHQIRKVVVRSPAEEAADRRQAGPSVDALGQPVGAPPRYVPPPPPAPGPPADGNAWKRPARRTVMLGAAAIFVAAMIVVTGVEAVAGSQLSHVVYGHRATGSYTFVPGGTSSKSTPSAPVTATTTTVPKAGVTTPGTSSTTTSSSTTTPASTTTTSTTTASSSTTGATTSTTLGSSSSTTTATTTPAGG